jgi:tetratricopeptide (TPR) repeat protein
VRFGNAVVAYVRYIGKAFWPSRLAALYPHPGRLLPTWEIVASAALLIAVTALVLRWRDRRYLPAGWFWFLGTMVPVIGLVQVGVQAMADRYAYLSFIGLFICVVWGATELAQARKIPAGWLAAPAAVILLTLGMLTRQQIPYWHDSESLWRHTLSVTERNYFAHNLLAYALEDQGRTEEAISEFNASEALHDYSPSALVAVGIFEQTHGHVPEAIAQYQKSLEISTDSKSRAEAMGHLGSAYIQTGDAALARTSYVYALQQDPDNAVALVGNALLAERDGDFGSAAVQISRAMQVSPTGVGYVLLAQALRRDGRLAEAREALTRAQQLSPDLLQAEQSAARVLITVGIKPE